MKQGVYGVLLIFHQYSSLTFISLVMNESISEEPFNEALKKIKDYHFTNNLTKKIANPPNLKRYNYFCMWSDLLGFGKMWTDCDWKPNIFQSRKIYKRLQRAHSAVLYYSLPFERNLILNDGIAKVLSDPNFLDKSKLTTISIFLRSCIQLHIHINAEEHDHGYPGTRSVLAYGMGIEYLYEQVTFDDYVFNYTKPKGSDTSSMVKEHGDVITLYNPRELQMNTAFSKAYLLESLGSKMNIEGNNLFIDQSILDALFELAKKGGIEPFKRIENDSVMIVFPYNKNNTNAVYMGFEFDKTIPVENRGWKTTVYRLKRFFPHDEKTDEFCFEL